MAKTLLNLKLDGFVAVNVLLMATMSYALAYFISYHIALKFQAFLSGLENFTLKKFSFKMPLKTYFHSPV